MKFKYFYFVFYFLLMSLSYVFPNYFLPSFGEYVLFFAISLVVVSWASYQLFYLTHQSTIAPIFIFGSAIAYYMVLGAYGFNIIMVYTLFGVLLILVMILSLSGIFSSVWMSALVIKKIKLLDSINNTSVQEKIDRRGQEILVVVEAIAKLIIILAMILVPILALIFKS